MNQLLERGNPQCPKIKDKVEEVEVDEKMENTVEEAADTMENVKETIADIIKHRVQNLTNYTGF